MTGGGGAPRRVEARGAWARATHRGEHEIAGGGVLAALVQAAARREEVEGVAELEWRGGGREVDAGAELAAGLREYLDGPNDLEGGVP